ncbi:MAG: hypothetical protein V1794_13250 [Candidatus Glassbacteria bacterium]
MNRGLSRYLIVPLSMLVLFGCTTRPTFFIELQLPFSDTPCQGTQIEFLSYNYPAVLDSLVQVNKPGPRPDSTDLMALLATYQEVLDRSARVADSVDRMRDELEKMDNRSVDYRKKYPVFQAVDKQMQGMLDRRHQVHEQYLQVKSVYDMKLQQWSESAYKGFGDFKTTITPELQTKVETTDQDCMVKKLQLPFGRWWLHAEARRPGSTNEMLIWDIALPTAGDSIMITLNEENANIRSEPL